VAANIFPDGETRRLPVRPLKGSRPAGPTLTPGLTVTCGRAVNQNTERAGIRRGARALVRVIPVLLVLGLALQARAAPAERPNWPMELSWQPVAEASAGERLEPAKDSGLVLAQASQMSPMEWSTDRPGLDYSSFEQPADDPAYCAKACAQDAQCMAWTYVRPYTIQGPYPRCWLKYAIPQPHSNGCCVSGQKLTAPQHESHMSPMEGGINRAGADFNSFNLPDDDPGLCLVECQRDQRCRAWTYVRPGVQGPWPRCWLKGAVPSARPDPCCVSGTKLD
jgi:hypothetical protein